MTSPLDPGHAWQGLACAPERSAGAVSAGSLRWEVDGTDWPHRETSRFVRAGGLQWHVQRMGEGPALLLLHGTGASTHSFRALAPRLAAHFTVIAPDLPGHAFTEGTDDTGAGLPGMARGLAQLLRALDVRPVVVVGHSAGAAILARMCLDGRITPSLVVSLNGALLPWRGLAGHVFRPLAQILAATPFAHRLFARRAADRAAVERLIAGTGSRLDREGIDLYARLTGNPGHVSGALRMMAAWDLAPLERDLPRLTQPLVLVAGSRDATVPPDQARDVAALLPTARIVTLPGLGHLAHEEAPDTVATLLLDLARDAGARVTE
jgi:magnesium chelatase accessory protein